MKGRRSSIRHTARLSRSTNPSFHGNRFLFHRRRGITDRETLIQITFKKRPDAAQPFILRRVRQLMDQQSPLTPMVGAEGDSVAQWQTGGERRYQLHLLRRRPQHRVFRTGYLFDARQPDPFRMDYTGELGVGQLRGGQCHTVLKNGSFLLENPGTDPGQQIRPEPFRRDSEVFQYVHFRCRVSFGGPSSTCISAALRSSIRT